MTLCIIVLNSALLVLLCADHHEIPLPTGAWTMLFLSETGTLHHALDTFVRDGPCGCGLRREWWSGLLREPLRVCWAELLREATTRSARRSKRIALGTWSGRVELVRTRSGRGRRDEPTGEVGLRTVQ